MTEANGDRFRTIVYGIVAAAGLAFLGWVGSSVNVMSDRLTTLEVTVRENREAREEQISDLRVRVNRLEESEQDERRARYRAEN